MDITTSVPNSESHGSSCWLCSDTSWSMFWRYQKWNDDMNDMKYTCPPFRHLAQTHRHNEFHLRKVWQRRWVSPALTAKSVSPTPMMPRQVTRKGSLRALMIKLVALGSTSTLAWRFLSSTSCTHAVAATLIRLKLPEDVGF